MLLLMLLLISGCKSVKLENSQRLMNHPEFPKAAMEAPEFTREALKTINKLEYELERPE
jgi:putative NADH-flavin reductase